MEIRNVILFLNFSYLMKLALATEDKIKKEMVLSIFENDFIYKIGDVTDYVTKTLADYNDRHLGNSEWGKMLGYNELKPSLYEDTSRKGRGLKKMSMAMVPLIFHIGATSTWMLITSIMAAKAVAIGLLLLVFKIAVSSAKVASFFTLLKAKHHGSHHSWAWAPPHGLEHDRSLSHKDIPVHDWSSYSPEWAPGDHHSSEYKTIPSMYKEPHISPYEVVEYEESKAHEANKKYR